MASSKLKYIYFFAAEGQNGVPDGFKIFIQAQSCKQSSKENNGNFFLTIEDGFQSSGDKLIESYFL